jgi:hypothetical protein
MDMERNQVRRSDPNHGPCPDAPLTIEEAVKVLPGNVSTKTLYRWATAGLRGIVLDSWFIGGRRYTSHESIDRFNAAVTEARTGKRRPAASHNDARERLRAKHGI